MSPALDGGGHGGGHGVQEENRAKCHRQKWGPSMPAHRPAEALGHGAMVSQVLFVGDVCGGAGFCSQRPLSSPAHPKVAAAHPGAPERRGLQWTAPVCDAESPSLVKGPLGSRVWSGPPPWSCPGELPGLQEPWARAAVGGTGTQPLQSPCLLPWLGSPAAGSGLS